MKSTDRPAKQPTPQTSQDSSSQTHQSDRLIIGLLGLLVILFFWRVTLLGQVLMPLDAVLIEEPWRSELGIQADRPLWNPVITDAVWQFYPMASYASQAWANHIPLWDPYVLSGMPALARGEMFSNPVFNILALFLPFDRALSWGGVLHILIALVATYLLLREMKAGQIGALVGALAFGLNGYLLGWLEMPPVTGSMVWLPVVYLGIERAYRRRAWAWTLLGALGFASQILSGSILWPFYAGVTLVLLSFYRTIVNWFSGQRSLTAFAPVFYTVLVLGFGTGLAAFQLFPTIELFLQTQRGTLMGASSGLHWPNLLRFVTPNLTGSPLHENRYVGPFNHAETHIYFGILPLAFAGLSLFSDRRKLAAGHLGLGLSALLAVYFVPPFRQIISLIYPVFLAAFPGRIFYLVAFTWAVAAGLGTDWILRRRPKRALMRLAVAMSILLVAMLGLYTFAKIEGQPIPGLEVPEDYVVIFSRYISTNGLLLGAVWLAIATGLFWYASLGRAPRHLLGPLVASIVIVDLVFAGIGHNPAFPREMAFPETPGIEFLQERLAAEDQPVRMAPVNSGVILFGLTPQLYRMPTVTGYSSWILERYARYGELSGDRPMAGVGYVYLKDCCDPLINALNLKYIYASPNTPLTSLTGDLSLISEIVSAEVTSGLDQVPSDQMTGSLVWSINGIERPVLYAHPPTQITYTISLDGPSTFKAMIGMDPGAWDAAGDGVLFELYATAPDEDSAGERLFSRYIDPKHVEADRDWIPVEVALPDHDGESLLLTLVTDPGPEGDTTTDWAGWGDVRVTDAEPTSLSLIYDGPNKIYLNEAALPRAWVVHRVTEVPRGDLDAVAQYLADADFDPATEAVVETDVASPRLALDQPPAAIDEPVTITSYSAHEVTAQVHMAQDGLLVLSEVFYPGWRAEVDGEARPILATDMTLRGVYLDAGDHTVVFTYRPPVFFIGLGFSLFTVAAAVITWIVLSKRRQTQSVDGKDGSYA